MTPENADLVERLDRITAILKLAHSEALNVARSQLRSEPAKAAIMDTVSNGWMQTKTVQERAARKANASERTIRDHLIELVGLGVLEKRGEARNTEYRSTGVIS